MTELRLPMGSLVVFIDETGHETLAPGHRVYGLGGCAVLEQHLDPEIRFPWREIRRAIKGDVDAPLHAADITFALPRDKQALIGDFFRARQFMRIAVAATTETQLPDPLKLIEVVAPALMKRIVDVFKWTKAASLSIIFEKNQRTNALIQRHFGPLAISEDGQDIPIGYFFMEKSAGEPGLEVADFIMHAVHGMARARLEGRNGYDRLDFQAAFHAVTERQASFMLIEKVLRD
jgi:hypothetical protein